MCLPLHWRTGAYGCTHWCIRAFVHVCMYAFVHLWIDVIARLRASAKAAPPETDPRAPGLPRNQLVSQCRPSSVSLKNASLGCGTPASSRTDSQHGFPPTCPIPPTGRMGAHASVAWMVNTSVVRSGTTGFWVTRAPSMGSGGAVFAVRRANEKCTLWMWPRSSTLPRQSSGWNPSGRASQSMGEPSGPEPPGAPRRGAGAELGHCLGVHSDHAQSPTSYETCA